MKKSALAISIILSLSVSSTVFAATEYAGGRLADDQAPSFKELATPAQDYAKADPEVAAAKADPEALAATEQAAAKEKNKTKHTGKKQEATTGIVGTQENLPITLYGDHVIYHQDSGDFEAEGNVRVYQGTQQMFTAKLQGNMHQGDMYLNDGGTLIDGATTTKASWVHYNFNTKTGEMKTLKGKSEDDNFSAPHADIYADHMELDEGATTTRCPAVKHPPCLEVKAKKVVIYPKDRLIAHDVKVFVKGKHIYSRDRWINNLKDKNNQSLMPRIGHSSEHGWELSYQFQQPLSDKTQYTADMVYYSKIGWRPMQQVHHDERNFYVNYKYGHEEDSDNNWIKKENDITVGYKAHKFTDQLPLNYSMYYNHGLWKDNWHSSWHTEYGAFISHDRISWGDKYPLFLDLGVGHKWTQESINDSRTKTMLYNVVWGKALPSKVNAWLGYYWQKNENNIFRYDNPDMARELQWGVSKEFSRDAVSFMMRYDQGKSKVYENIWRWKHNFCCFELSLEYKDKKYEDDDQLSIQYDLARW